LATSFLLTACATQTAKQLVDADKSVISVMQLCCKSLADAKTIPLPTERAEFLITPEVAQLFDFDGTRSLFLLFQLPEYKAPYTLILTSLPKGLVDRTLFLPSITFLGADFRERRAVDAKSGRTRGGIVEHAAFVNEKDSGDRYLLIRSAGIEGQATQTVPQLTTTPIIAGPVIFMWTDGRDTQVRTMTAPTGVIRIELQKSRTIETK
jgi:hypothetical protein